MAKAGKGAAAKKAATPRRSPRETPAAAEAEEDVGEIQSKSPFWSMAKVLGTVFPLVAAGYGAVYKLQIEPCKEGLAACSAGLQTEQGKWPGAVPRDEHQEVVGERDELRRQLAASRASLKKIPQAIAYLEGLEMERARVEQDIEMLTNQLEQLTATAAVARDLCSRSGAGSDACKAMTQQETAAKAIPGRIDAKRKRADLLTQQIQDAVAKLGGTG